MVALLPLAPIALLPVPEPELVVSVLAVPLPVVPLEPAAVLPLPVALPVVLLSVVAPVLGKVLLLPDPPVVPVAAPAAGVEVLPEADDPVPEPAVPLPEVWAMDSPPMANAAAAARVVRVFLVVIIYNSLEWKPRREWVLKSRHSPATRRLSARRSS